MTDLALRILLIEDHDELRALTLALLRQHGHDVRGVPMAQDIDDVTGDFLPDIYLIDLNLPDEDGLALTRRIRAAHQGVGIVITTARVSIGDKVVGYESGADQYLTKPVHPKELLACIDALGKRLRSQKQEGSALTLDLTTLRLSGPTGTTELTASDAQILHALTRAPGRSLERWQIAQIFGVDKNTSVAAMEMRIARLRKKLVATGAPAPAIKAVHKVGYVLCCTVALR